MRKIVSMTVVFMATFLGCASTNIYITICMLILALFAAMVAASSIINQKQ